VDGRPLAGASCATESTNLGGMELGDKAVLLVTDYTVPDGTSVAVRLPRRWTGRLEELTPDGPNPTSAPDGKLTVTFGPCRARVFRMIR
jgi:hypothetical protein